MGAGWSWLPLAAALVLGGCAAPGQYPGGTNQAGPSQAGPSQADGAASDPGVLNVADAAISSGDPDMALKISQSVLASDPHNLQALYHEAAAYYAVGRCEDAMAAYKLALGVDPTSADAQTGIGRCLLKLNAGAAEQAFVAAVADDPNDAAAQNDLGIARDLLGDFSGATAPYQQALLLDPGNGAIEVNLGLSLALAGDPQDALQYLGPLANGPGATPKIREDYATALLAAGQAGEARQVLAIDVPPQQLDAAIATLSSLIAPPMTAPPPPPAQPQVAAPAPVAATPLTPPAVPPTAAATPAPAPPVQAAAAPPPPASGGSLPLADTPPPNPSQPTAPSAVVAIAPAIPGPAVTAPPPPLH